MPAALGGQKGASVLELELWMAVSHHVGAGDQTGSVQERLATQRATSPAHNFFRATNSTALFLLATIYVCS